MSTRRLPLLVLTLALACTPKQDDEGADASTGTGDGDGDGDGDGMGPEDSDGPPTPADFAALCEMQVDRAACEAVPTETYPWEDQVTWCTWQIEVPVTLVADACVFGEATATCRMASASEVGCAEPSLACGQPDIGWSRSDGDRLVIGRANLCTSEHPTCTVADDGTVEAGVPECACLCDPAFPSE
jgi:hypothetical protein